MFKALLIFKYLRRKLAPMFAALAVTICTLMVIVVISVMGGFLDLLRTTVHHISGDVIVSSSLAGFAHYEELIKQLDDRPEVAASAAVVRSFGLLELNQQTIPVEVEGVAPEQLNQVVSYRDSLYWSGQQFIDYFRQRDDLPPRQALSPDYRRALDAFAHVRADGMTFDVPEAWQPSEGAVPGIVLGIAVNRGAVRDEHGRYVIGASTVSSPVTLTLVPLSKSGTLGAYSPVHKRFVVVNESKSGHYEIDSQRVYIPLAVAQRMLEMDRRKVWKNYDPQTGEPIGEPTVEPARVTEVIVRGAAGYSLEQVDAAVHQVSVQLMQAHPDMMPLYTQTWKQKFGTLLGAVENEKGLVTFLFAIISIVAIVMVATTFYMIVLEKTRDIGVLRAVGASRLGILNIFLGYGLAVGVVGALLGFVLAYLIVTNLNQIQYWLANELGVTVLYVGLAAVVGLIGAIVGAAVGWCGRKAWRRAWQVAAIGVAVGCIAAFLWLWFKPDFGDLLNHTISFRMWDPRVYAFDHIPDKVEPVAAAVIVIGGIVSAVVGALIPAVLAARLDPIEALRYE